MKIKIAVAVALSIFTITITSIFIANWANNGQNSSTGSSDQPAGGNTQNALTADEVAKHASRDNCWVIIANDVYDVTSFIRSHPGGVDILAAQCGKDATTGFQTQGGTGGSHSAAVQAQLQTLKIGSLVSASSAPTASPGDQSQPVGANLPAVITERYPSASLISSESEGDEERYNISVDGQCREIRIQDEAIERNREC